MDKIFRWASWAGVILAVLLILVPGTGEAARHNRMNELNYFQTTELTIDGRQAFRIEIGMERAPAKYTASVSAPDRQITVDLQNMKRGELHQDIRLHSKLADSLHIRQSRESAVQVQVHALQSVDAADFRVYTAERDRRARKPYRLVIDLLEPQTDHGGSWKELSGRAVVIDPGHGGSDSGAIGSTGVMEKEVTLSVSKKIRELLERSGARVRMTRLTDVDVYAPNDTAKEELQARCDVVNQLPGAEAFVSVHCNSFSNPAAHGMETYYYAPSAGGRRLAARLNEELARAGGLYNRGVKQAEFYVLKHNRVPASLIEIGFISNEREEAMLRDESYQWKIAGAAVRALARYFSEGSSRTENMR